MQCTHGWIQCVVVNLQPFWFVEKYVFRRHFKENSISKNFLSLYLGFLTVKVEGKTADLFPNRFAIVLDGWSCDSTHYVGVFATFSLSLLIGYEKVSLAVSPMADETTQNSGELTKLIEFVLSVFKKDKANTATIIGDNNNISQAFSQNFVPHFVGCHSHLFNLAVKDIISD